MDLVLSMSVFRRVAELENFSEVARELDLSQPTVSKHIAALEKHLSVTLLNRNTRQLSLTDIGKQYYERCVFILDELNETESSIRDQQSTPSGTLRINTPITFGELKIVPHLWKFLENQPELNIELIMDDHYVDLVKDGVDVAIRIGPLADSNLIAQHIGDSPRVTVASLDYIERQGEPETLQDLNVHNCIVYSLLTTGNEWHYSGPRGKETIRVDGRLSVNNPHTIRQAVLAGQGIAVTPLWLIEDEIKLGKVKPILTQYEPSSLEIHAIYPDRRFVAAKVRCFIDYIRDYF